MLATELLQEVNGKVVVRIGTTVNVAELDSIDAVLCLDAVEHIEDDVSALREIVQALGTETLVVLTVPACPTLYCSRDVQLGHYRRYSKRQLIELCENAGLQVRYCYYWNFIGILPY